MKPPPLSETTLTLQVSTTPLETNFDVGTIANDGTGEPLRQAFQEQQAMNTELYTTKVDKVVGKELSSNDFTDEQVIKLDGIEEGAEVNVQADWEQSDDTQKDYIKNKPTELFSSVGYFHYTDTETQTTPLTILPDTNKKLTNDGLGAQTNLTQAPYGVSSLFNTTTNEFDFSQLSIGDTLDLRVDLSLTTTSANQKYLVFLRVGEGSVAQYDLPIFSGQIKSISSDNRIIGNDPFSIDYQEHIDSPATLYIISDDDGSVKVNGWYAAIVRKSVNIINVKNNRQVKLINGTANYTLLQGDSIKFLVLQSEYDVVLPLELEDFTEFLIKNTSGSEREVTFDVNVVFEGSPLIPDNGLCILKKLFSSGVVETWSVNVVSESGGGFIPLIGTEVASPITGDLEFYNASDDIYTYLKYNNDYATMALGTNDFYVHKGGFVANYEDFLNRFDTVTYEDRFIIDSSNPDFKGLEGEQDYTANLTDLCYPQKIYVDDKLDEKEFTLTAGTNITIDRTVPNAPVISVSGGGGTSYQYIRQFLPAVAFNVINTWYSWNLGGLITAGNPSASFGTGTLPTTSGTWYADTGVLYLKDCKKLSKISVQTRNDGANTYQFYIVIADLVIGRGNEPNGQVVVSESFTNVGTGSHQHDFTILSHADFNANSVMYIFMRCTSGAVGAGQMQLLYKFEDL